MSRYHSTKPPKARVNITLELNSNGQKKKKELPMKLLVLGHFSGGDDSRKIADRPRYSVNKRTFNTLMARVLPTLTLNVPNHLTNQQDTLKLLISFQSLDDFTPQ